jgi:hypothetical protein
MPIITEEMIETCFEIFFTEDQNIDPALHLGMNRNSARMTIKWFRCLFNGELYKRRVPAMQVEWILNRLYNMHDFNRLRNVLISLGQYCDFYDNHPMHLVRHLVEEFEKRLAIIA